MSIEAREPAMDGSPPPDGWSRWTVFVRYPECVEEVDFDAVSEQAALAAARTLLAESYEPGWSELRAEQRWGWYL